MNDGFFDDDLPRLGPCCICGYGDNVTAIVIACDGARAVLCAHCVDDWQAGRKQLRFACRGYPATEGRVPIEQLTVPHEHDENVEH